MFDKLFNKLNDLNPRQLLILAGIVMFLMFITIYIFLSWFTAKEELDKPVNEPAQLETVAKQIVVVAKTDIPPLTVINLDMLQTKEIAADLVPEGAITSVEKVLNIPAKTEIFAGDVITERKLASDMKGSTFVGSIPADCRAVSISVNEITGVDGFAKPGDKVDLILVETDKNRRVSTSILLQDVLLLSINKNMDKTNTTTTTESGQVVTAAIDSPSIATFALHPDEVLRLVSASKIGEIYLTLRPLKPSTRYSGSTAYEMDSVLANKLQEEKQQPEPEPEKKEEVKPPVTEKVEPVKEKPAEVAPQNIEPETFEIIYGDVPSNPENEKKKVSESKIDEESKTGTDE
ncbi:MAG: Flp pilus assembly protein CpaB [Selenomonadaceae bacterium]|nr:Flp pilus assembly protein CpaB [Selenomonadaceae bacterium]